MRLEELVQPIVADPLRQWEVVRVQGVGYAGGGLVQVQVQVQVQGVVQVLVQVVQVVQVQGTRGIRRRGG